MRLFIPIILFLSISTITRSQGNSTFCKAVENEKFKKVERVIKKKVRKIKNGTTYYNGPGSGMQIDHIHNIDTLVMWMNTMPCIADAASDKCEIKISIFPGWIVIGAIFKSSKGISEKCFYIQEGTTGAVNIFGWRPHIFKMKNKLIYKKMYDCPGFVEQQKKNCNEFK